MARALRLAAAARHRHSEAQTEGGTKGRRDEWRARARGPATTLMMQFESHFKSYFGNVKAHLIFKKLKLSLSRSPQWPEAALLLGGDGKFLRQSLGRLDRLWT